VNSSNASISSNRTMSMGFEGGAYLSNAGTIRCGHDCLSCRGDGGHSPCVHGWAAPRQRQSKRRQAVRLRLLPVTADPRPK
jgi:hypothetical protein